MNIFARNMCPGSQQLRQHGVSVVNELQWLRWHTWNYFTLKKVKTNKKCNFIFSKIACQSSRWLCGHINDYVDTFWKLWRLLTDFKGTSRQKKLIGCVYTFNSNNLKIWKLLYLKKNMGVHVVGDYAGDRISSRKQKSSWNRFCLFIWVLGRIF